MRTPDLTAAQIVSIVGSVLALAVALGAPISHEASSAILSLVTVLAPVLLGADAVIRHGRATAHKRPATAPHDPDA